MKKQDYFARNKIISYVFLLLSRYGFYLILRWSNNKFLIPARRLNLSPTNQYKSYTYRLSMVYLNKRQSKSIDRFKLYSNKHLFLLVNWQKNFIKHKP